MTLLDPNLNVIAIATAPAAGKPAILQSVSTVGTTAGTYTVRVSGLDDSVGDYQVWTTLNAAIESERFIAADNDSLDSAQEINGGALPIGGTASQIAVAGSLGASTSVVSETFDSGILPASIATYSSNASGRIRVAPPMASGNSSAYALLMDSAADNTAVLNEAILTVNLSAALQANLSFRRVNYGDEADPLPVNFTGHANGDGVAISADGINWRTIYNAVSTDTAWTTSSIDLSFAAAAAGIPLTSDFKIKFQQFGSFPIGSDGRGFDTIVVSTRDVKDTFRLNLASGETASIAVKGVSSTAVNLELKNGAGQTLAAGIAGPTNFDKAIADFRATATDTYYIVVSGTATTDYTLLMGKNAALSTETNSFLSSAQPLLSLQVAGDQYVFGRAGAANFNDIYQVDLAAGATLNLKTFTPGDGAGEFVNTFNPRLRVLNTTGTQLAINDNGAPDGKNAVLTYTNTGIAGKFFVEVSSTTTTSTQGEYVLRVAGNSAVRPLSRLQTQQRRPIASSTPLCLRSPWISMTLCCSRPSPGRISRLMAFRQRALRSSTETP